MKNLLFLSILLFFIISCSDDESNNKTQETIPIPEYNYYYDLNGEWLSFSNSGLRNGTKAWLDEAASWSLGENESEENIGIKISNFTREEIEQNIYRITYSLELKEYVGNFVDGDVLFQEDMIFEYELTQEFIQKGELKAGDYKNAISNDVKFATTLASSFVGVGFLGSYASDLVIGNIINFLSGDEDVHKYEAFIVGYANAVTIQKAIYDLEQNNILPLPTNVNQKDSQVKN